MNSYSLDEKLVDLQNKHYLKLKSKEGKKNRNLFFLPVKLVLKVLTELKIENHLHDC